MKFRYTYIDHSTVVRLDNNLYFAGFFTNPMHLSTLENTITVDDKHPRFGEIEKILKDAGPTLIESQDNPQSEIKVVHSGAPGILTESF